MNTSAPAHRFTPVGIIILFVALSLSLLGGEADVPDKDNNVASVPPPGIAPFDPRVLMEALKTRITTDKFRFAVLGDSKNAKTLPGLLKYLDEATNPDFVLTTGDMVPSGGGKVGAGYYEMLTKDAGPAMRKRPWWPAVGNHEIAGNPIVGKEALKEDGAQQRLNQNTGIENFKKFYHLDSDYYGFEFRNCYFIALPFKHPTGKIFEWLEGELKKASEAKKHIFLFNHCPFFTVGTKSVGEVPNKETPLTALFKKYGVNAVFSGHDHIYYRTVRSGIPYFISAGGGAPIYPGLRVKEALPEDVYYTGVADTFVKGAKSPQFVLHKSDGTDTITDKPTQFLCVVDVDGNKITCSSYSVNGDKWDEIILSK